MVPYPTARGNFWYQSQAGSGSGYGTKSFLLLWKIMRILPKIAEEAQKGDADQNLEPVLSKFILEDQFKLKGILFNHTKKDGFSPPP